MSHTTPSKTLNINGVFLILIGFGAAIIVAMVILNQINKQRAEKVYRQYSTETAHYINNNSLGLRKIFEEINATHCESSYPCPSAKQDDIMHMISNNLTNFSSTSFVTYNADRDIILMRLSGDREILYSGDPTTVKMKDLLSGNISALPWDEYLFQYEGKEVIIPVRNEQGKIMGLLVRSVVEN